MSDKPGKRFVDISGRDPDDPDMWDPVLFTAAEIEAEIERLASLPAPPDGRRESLFVHPRATSRAGARAGHPRRAVRPASGRGDSAPPPELDGRRLRDPRQGRRGHRRRTHRCRSVRRVERPVVPDELAHERLRRAARAVRVLERAGAREAERAPRRHEPSGGASPSRPGRGRGRPSPAKPVRHVRAQRQRARR